MNDRAGLTANVLVIVVGAIATVLLIDFFPIIGLSLASATLVTAVILRSARVAAAVAMGSAVFLVLLLRQWTICNPAPQDCSNMTGVFVPLAWLAALTAIGALAVVLISRRKTAVR